MSQEPGLSLVIPIHNERANLAPVLADVEHALAGFRYEIVAVDDGSTDGSREELRRLAAGAPLRVVTLARRSGQSAALAAGFDAATLPIVVTMDADGQYDPADVPRLVAALLTAPGRAAVAGYRERRADSWWKVLQSRIANRVRDVLTGDRVRDTGCALKAMRRDRLVRLPRFDGMHRFLPTLFRLAGDEVIELPVAHRPRRHGTSHYGMRARAVRGLRDALGVRWLRARRLTYTLAESERREPALRP